MRRAVPRCRRSADSGFHHAKTDLLLPAAGQAAIKRQERHVLGDLGHANDDSSKIGSTGNTRISLTER